MSCGDCPCKDKGEGEGGAGGGGGGGFLLFPLADGGWVNNRLSLSGLMKLSLVPGRQSEPQQPCT